jgi:hypothetical protein
MIRPNGVLPVVHGENRRDFFQSIGTVVAVARARASFTCSSMVKVQAEASARDYSQLLHSTYFLFGPLTRTIETEGINRS